MITLAPAGPADASALAALMAELELFYGGELTEPKDDQIAQIHAALFAEPPLAYALLAWEGQQLVGMAAYAFLWPAAGFTTSLYLKELYVAEAHRRSGVGRLMMDRLHAIALERGCSRVEWTTDADNVAAQRFYEQLGTPRNASKLFYRSALS